MYVPTNQTSYIYTSTSFVVTNLITFVDYVSCVLDKSSSRVYVICTDFQKTFDKVDHSILPAKILSESLFTRNLIKLFESYP